MMNIQEYINSGIIEDYCLGVLSPEERQAVAQNAMLYPEIQTAIEENELALKRYVEDTSVDKQTNPMEKELLLKLLKNTRKY
jgi:anti-sigma-K factor RskA